MSEVLIDSVSYANAPWATTIPPRQAITMPEEVSQTLDGMYFAQQYGLYAWRIMVLERVDLNGEVWYRECATKICGVEKISSDKLLIKYCLNESEGLGKLVRSYLVLPLTDNEGNIDITRVQVRGKVHGTNWKITTKESQHIAIVETHSYN